MKKKILVFLLALTFTISFLSGCGSSSGTVKKVGTAPDGNEVKIEAASMKLVKAQKEGGYELVNTETLKKWINEKKDMIIIDTMPKDNFDKEHIPGAVQAELPTEGEATAEQKDAFVKLLGNDKNKTIVVYCGFVACERSHLGAKYAKELGFTNAYRYPGGIIGWKDAGNQVVK